MKNLIWITWVGWWRTPGRIIPLIWLMLLCACGPSIGMTFMKDAAAAPCDGSVFGLTGWVALFSLAAGVISRERESGTLATIFARPVTRATYVLSKWIALFSAAVFVGTISLLISLLVYALTQPALIAWASIPNMLSTCTFLLLGLSAVFVLCSSFGAVTSDLSSFLTVVGMAGMISMVAMAEVPPSCLVTLPPCLVYAYNSIRGLCFDVMQPLWFFLIPFVKFPIEPHRVVGTLLAFFSNLTLCLLVTVWLINRREVGYGNNG